MSLSRETNPDDAKLAEAGFDPAVAPADAIAKLRELKGKAGIADVSIARALGNIADTSAAAMLVEMETGAAGAIRREVRRALYKMKQHGIDAPESGAPAVSTVQDNASEKIDAMLSPIDIEGARIVWIVKPRVQGGVIRMWALISERDGLVGAQNTGLSRRELKSEREELERRAQIKLVDADWRVADFIACEAWRNTPESRRGHVGNFLTLRSELIASPPPTELVHPVYGELAAEAAGEPSVDLLKEPELLEWRLPDAFLKPYVDEIAQAGESVIVLSPVHKQERVNAVIDRATAQLLSGDSGRRIQRRLEDIAYYLARVGRRTQAGWATAAAARIRDGIDVTKVLFFQAFIRTQLGTVAAAEQQKAEAEPRLIMTPAEAMRAREAREARTRRR
ncbi:MAG TPA: hypothetical protein VJX68_08595 [Candidatus Binatus sp.]|uniref:hypothetical protein n=1 Tax=Candidatus Binatus sp. TaxID=2811406 RepID=UPI002B46237E|nr:hypothetical protein [Candidatus Binatus sp.]HKN13241.1 hypothetical protein [Candidatus Binatus sp.]